MKINITAVLKSKVENAAKVKGLLQNLVADSRKEKGCIQYDLHQDIENSNVFILHEVWENKEILDLHNNQKHSKTFFGVVPDLLIEKPTIIFTNRIV